jgi:hypothetical protein
MREPSPEAFERALAGLSQPALAAFVADLWAARGWETRVETRGDGIHVVCTRADGTTRLLVPDRRFAGATLRRAVRDRLRRGSPGRMEHGADADTRDTVDIVVSPVPDARVESVATAAGARLYDARSLYDLALYGLDRAAADAIFRHHLGDGITISADPKHPSDGPVAWWRRWPPDAPAHGFRTLVVIVAAVALVGALVVSVGTGFGGFAGGGVETGSTGGALGDGFEMAPGPAAGQGDAGGFVGVDPEGTGPPPGDGTVTDGPRARLLAPGLTRDGVTSADALAAAHASRVDGRSYVWRVNYTERSAGEVTQARTAHRVRNASVLRVDVDTTGVFATDPGRLVPWPAYADGSRRYVLAGGRVLVRPPESRDHYAGHAEIVLSRLLRANESEVVDARDDRETDRYQVSLSGAPVPDRQAYRATALVTSGGVVHVVEAEWVDRESNVTVSVRMTYDFVDDPTVTRPDWMGSANDVRTDNSTARPSFTPTVA